MFLMLLKFTLPLVVLLSLFVSNFASVGNTCMNVASRSLGYLIYADAVSHYCYLSVKSIMWVEQTRSLFSFDKI